MFQTTTYLNRNLQLFNSHSHWHVLWQVGLQQHITCLAMEEEGMPHLSVWECYRFHSYKFYYYYYYYHHDYYYYDYDYDDYYDDDDDDDDYYYYYYYFVEYGITTRLWNLQAACVGMCPSVRWGCFLVTLDLYKSTNSLLEPIANYYYHGNL